MDQNQLATELGESIEKFSAAISAFRTALHNCREAGMSDTDIRDAIAETLPEADRAGFIAQWPMIQMMFAMI